jgi:hypothetical protein
MAGAFCLIDLPGVQDVPAVLVIARRFSERPESLTTHLRRAQDLLPYSPSASGACTCPARTDVLSCWAAEGGRAATAAADGTVLPLAAGATVTRAGPPGGRTASDWPPPHPRQDQRPVRRGHRSRQFPLPRSSPSWPRAASAGRGACYRGWPTGKPARPTADLQPLGLYCRSLSGEVVPLVEVGDQAGVAGFPAQLLPGGRV